MMTRTAADARLDARCREILARCAAMPLLELPDGRVLTLAEGALPLLVNYTEEDRAAKGLRSLRERTAEPPPPVHFSALEVAGEPGPLLLLGARGAGKSVFAADLARRLATARLRPGTAPAGARPVARNDRGTARPEAFDIAAVPLLIAADRPEAFIDLLHRHWPAIEADLADAGSAGAFLIVDGAEHLEGYGPQFLDEALRYCGEHPQVRLVVLGETRALRSWRIPQGFRTHSLLPLLAAQRRDLAASVLAPRGVDAGWLATLPPAANPALLALALAAGRPAASAEALADAWLARPAAAGAAPDGIEAACLAAVEARRDVAVPAATAGTILALRSRAVVEILAARRLADGDPKEAAARFHGDPDLWFDCVASLARRLTGTDRLGTLAAALVSSGGDSALQGALLVAETVEAPALPAVAAGLLRIVDGGLLSPVHRDRAARILAQRGDPRDLEALAEVPGGTFTMGSRTHPNSDPPHEVTVAPFRIGVHPVTNGLYRRFIEDTGLPWLSADGRLPERANAPAVDLSWRDARAYCGWLTARWRQAGRIGATEVVRLPSEPEWERAARGDQPDSEDIVYPWGGAWDADAANSEDAGFNGTTAVGLFPEGRSPFGCLDMAGQVWEWTTTLWGTDMASPAFRYPYRDDGREDPGAGPAVRRVLRGGCFSSGRLKACCTYRGSLEPDGTWRGNGFRIVVAPAG